MVVLSQGKSTSEKKRCEPKKSLAELDIGSLHAERIPGKEGKAGADHFVEEPVKHAVAQDKVASLVLLGHPSTKN